MSSEYDNYLAQQKAAAELATKKFNALVKAVAAALGGKVEPSEHFSGIDLGAGLGLHLHKVWNAERMEVSGQWPKTAKGEVQSPSSRYDYVEGLLSSITVSVDRTAEAIATDVARRFLPGYKAQFAKQLERVKGYDQHADDTRETSIRVSQALGQPVLKETSGSSHDRPRLSLDLKDDCGYGHVTVSGKTVDIDIRGLPIEHAEVVLQSLRCL